VKLRSIASKVLCAKEIASSRKGSYAIGRAELKRCEDLMMSRLAAQHVKAFANCSLKLDWILRYRTMAPNQGNMAEDRYAEYCPTK
jgi:hypothetical protein